MTQLAEKGLMSYIITDACLLGDTYFSVTGTM